MRFGFLKYGGRYKTRTCDLPHVKRMRYQLRQSSLLNSACDILHIWCPVVNYIFKFFSVLTNGISLTIIINNVKILARKCMFFVRYDNV